ncbi:GAF domain-containing protein [Paenibacillus frigoriresistens]|uniref:GAF domain-containing protein n=1 Tax=Paenibacillus alginolyticus TaxID=59839 RepID=UPI001565C388|nr:GAF domain-containing protein [Paenibacillus frigoriresistens]NRF94638.1 GAF domain-containing protein [Paenibacillus frigoriresistens]
MIESKRDLSFSELQLRLNQNELLIDAAQYFTSSLALDEVITRILDRALMVIEAADAGVLFIYNKYSGYLKAMACVGFIWDKIRHIDLSPGESMTGLTFESRIPRIFQNSDDVIRTIESMSPTNKILYDESLAPIKNAIGEGFMIQSVMCAPLLIKGECIGVMTIDNFNHGSFSENDLNLLITLSNLAAIALENARLYQDEKGKKEKLEELNNVIQSKNHQLYRINQTHERLMNLILSGKSTLEFGAAVFSTLENPIIIYDNLLSVLTQQVHADLGFDIGIPPFMAELQNVLKNWKSVRIKPKTYKTLPYSVMLFPIVTSNEIFGILAVMDTNNTLSEQDVVLAEQCCLVLALDLLKREAVYETEQRVKGEFLDELISEKNVGILRERAKSLGLSTTDSFVLLVVDIEFVAGIDQDAQLKAVHRSIQKTIETELLNLNPYSLVIGKFNTFVIVLALSKEIDNGTALKRSRILANGSVKLCPNGIPV